MLLDPRTSTGRHHNSQNNRYNAIAYPVVDGVMPPPDCERGAEIIDPLNYYNDSYEGRAFRALAGDAAVRERLALLKKADEP